MGLTPLCPIAGWDTKRTESGGSEISNKLVGTERHYGGGSLVFVLCLGIDTKSHGLHSVLLAFSHGSKLKLNTSKYIFNWQIAFGF